MEIPKKKVIQIMPVTRQLDAILRDDTEPDGILRCPVLYLSLVEIRESYGDEEEEIYTEVRMCDIEYFSDVTNEDGFENFAGFLGVEIDGVKKDWIKEIKRYKEINKIDL